MAAETPEEMKVLAELQMNGRRMTVVRVDPESLDHMAFYRETYSDKHVLPFALIFHGYSPDSDVTLHFMSTRQDAPWRHIPLHALVKAIQWRDSEHKRTFYVMNIP